MGEKKAIEIITFPNIKSAALTTGIGVLLVIWVLNPIWQQLNLHVPGEPKARVDFTQLVDSVFYIRNAENGYNWTTDDKISTAFHPLLVWAISILPLPIPSNIRFWLISILAGFFSLIAIQVYIKEVSTIEISPFSILWVLVLPGGLGIATSNAEFPCLLFTSLLAISVIKKWSFLWPLLFGVLAILTKPNAAYMIPFLGVYAILMRKMKLTFARPEIDSTVITFTSQISAHQRKIIRNSWLGILGILLAWVGWIIFTDIQLGEFGGYFKIREYYTVPLDRGIFSLLKRTATVLLLYANIGEQLKFLTAIIIPLVLIWISLTVPLKEELDRVAIIVGIISIVLLALVTNNPNKIVVYVTTFPGSIAIGIIFFQKFWEAVSSKPFSRNLDIIITGIGFLLFCGATIVFYILGTPYGWYY